MFGWSRSADSGWCSCISSSDVGLVQACYISPMCSIGLCPHSYSVEDTSCTCYKCGRVFETSFIQNQITDASSSSLFALTGSNCRVSVKGLS